MKKEVLKRTAVIGMSLTLTFGAVGCAGLAKDAPNTTSDIEIVYWESGWGRAFMDNLISAFTEKHPEYNVILDSSAAVNNVALYEAPDTNTVDLYVTTFELKNAYKDLLEPMEDLLASKPDGEHGKTISEKLGSYQADYTLDDGHVYSLPWTMESTCGLLYNVDMWLKDGSGNLRKTPRTSDELAEYALELYTKENKTPFIFYGEYWAYLTESWTAQYEGLEKFKKEWKGIYTDSEGVEHENDVRFIVDCQGRYESIKALEKLLYRKGYAYTNSNSLDVTTAQTLFLNKKAVMMPSGSWIENEMKNNGAHIKLMKTPVISALKDVLGIKSDAHLRILVDYVDGETLNADELEIVNTYSDTVIERVRDARSIHYCGAKSSILIPNYSIAKEGAYEFVKFMYSDEGLKITQDTIKTGMGAEYTTKPEIDTSDWSYFMKDLYTFSDNVTKVNFSLDKKIFYDGGITKMNYYWPSQTLVYREDGGQETAAQYWAKEVNYWENNWEGILTNAGLRG